MIDTKKLLEFTKKVAEKSALELTHNNEIDALKNYQYDNDLKREIKANADIVLEKNIISQLQSTGIPILSEESGLTLATKDSEYLFIVDPLDGTFNFVKNFGSCAISIALWHKDKPIFGVIYDLYRQELYWGGKGLGAFCDGSEIKVSYISDIEKSLICSGFPVRYDLKNLYEDNYMKVLTKFAKVRMIGSAAISIINVCRGASEAYFEKNIMIWDIAAGLAILEGSGGSYTLIETTIEKSYDVIVGNKTLLNKIKGLMNEH